MPQKLSKAQFAALVESMPGASEEEILSAAKKAEGSAEPGIIDKALDAAKRYGSTVASDVGNLALGLGKMLITPPLDQARDLSLAAAARIAAKDYSGLGTDAAEMATGIPLHQMKEDFQKGNYPELAGHATVAAGTLLLPHMMGKAHPVEAIQSRAAVGPSLVERQSVPAEALPAPSPVLGRPSADVPPVARMAGDVPPEFHSVLDSFSDPAKFVDPQKSPLVDGSAYGILTAANPDGAVLSAAENAARNAELVKALKAKGLNPLPQQGFFGGEPEPSFLVPGLSTEDAIALGKQFNQHSVLTNQGLQRLADGKSFPIQAVRFPQDAKEYYSQIEFPGRGPVKYQMDIPPEAFEPATPSATEAPKATELPQKAAEGATGKGEASPRIKGSTTALGFAAPVAAAAIPDDPDSKLDDYGRIGLTLAGMAGLGAAVRGRQVAELSPLQEAIHKGAAALWLGGKKAWKQVVGPEASPQLLAASQKVLDRHLQTTANQMPTMKKLLAMNKKGVADHEWYDKTSAELKDMFGQDADLVARLFAATSNNATVMANASLAMKAYRQIKAGEPITGFLPDVIENVKRAAAGEPLNGRKIDNFAKALAGDPDAVVIDRWIMRAFGFNKGTAPTDLQYDFMENAIKQIAKEQNQTPRQVQAAIWFAFKNEAEKGKKRPPSPAPPQAIQRSIDIRHGEALRENRKFDRQRAASQQPNMFGPQ